MKWSACHRRAAAELHLPAGIEDHDLVANRPNGREVVADEHIGDAELAPQLRHEVEYGGADNRIESRGYLVA